MHDSTTCNYVRHTQSFSLLSYNTVFCVIRKWKNIEYIHVEVECEMVDWFCPGQLVHTKWYLG